MNTPTATTRAESAVFIPAGDDDLCAIVTQPTGSAKDTTVVLLHGGGRGTSAAANRIWVRMARALSAEGFTVVRFDGHGSGDSSGRIEEYRLDQPLVGDLDSVCAWMRDRGSQRFAFVGTCLGARTAIAVAANSDDVDTLALLTMPIRDWAKGDEKAALADRTPLRAYVRPMLRWRVIKRLRDPRWRRTYSHAVRAKARSLTRRRSGVGAASGADFAWLSPELRSDLQKIVERSIPTLFVFGTSDGNYDDFRRAVAGPLADLAIAGAALDAHVVEVAGDLPGFPTLDSQQTVISHVTEWLVTQCPPRRSEAGTL